MQLLFWSIGLRFLSLPYFFSAFTLKSSTTIGAFFIIPTFTDISINKRVLQCFFVAIFTFVQVNKLSTLLNNKKHNRQLDSKQLNPIILLREVISRITSIYSCNQINSCFLVLFAYWTPFHLILTVLLWFYNAPSTRKPFHLWFAISRTIVHE